MEKQNRLGQLIIVGLILVIVLMTFRGSPDIKVVTGNENSKGLSVSGNAELTVSPDKATVYVNIVTEGETATIATEQNKEISNKVLDALKKSNVKDTETNNFYLSKKTKWDKDLRKSVDDGFILTHTIKVTTEDIDNV
tara:strand:+ start:343 stop:756 length:414 start_codon:yes stop_codon:yes gene_type:complete